MDTGVEVFAADVPAWLVRIASFVFGALWGSFFNVAIYRWPRGMSVVRPPSHCPACGAPVRWYLNVPIFGYLLLRGRARCCGAPLTARYVWVELLTAVLCVAVAEQRFVNAAVDASMQRALLDTLLYFTFVGGLVIATFVDLEWMEIPDEVSLPCAALGLATVGFRSGPSPVDAAVGAGVGFLIVQLLFVWGYENLMGRRGMGEGDAKLLLMIGAFLGWEAVLFCLLAGSVQGLVVAGVAMATGMPLVPQRPDELDEEGHEALASTASTEPAAPSTPEAASPAAEDTSAAARNAAPEGVAPGPDVASVRAPASAEPGEVDAHPGPPMMVFGPMLALAALEYLFFGERIISTVSAWLGR